MTFTSRAAARERRALLLAAICAAALAALTACGSSTSTGAPASSTPATSAPAGQSTASAPASSASGAAASQPTGSPLTVADVAPFSGPDAALGPTYLASCYGATAAINAAGGVNGHPLTCKSVDTRGDPADAVPAVNQMFASTSGLSLVIGCTSDEAAAVAPVINAHKMAMFCMTGQSEFDSVHFPYFYRLVPPDLEESYAMVAIAQQLHYKKIALAFGNDIGSQTFIQPAIAALKKAGLTLTTNQTLDLNATTFRTEAEAIVSSHPDAIMTEALGSADPTLFSEIKQLNGGTMIPVIGTSAAISPPFFKAAAAAVGASTFASQFHADNLVTETSGPAFQAFSAALLAQQGKVPGATGDFTTYLSAPGGVHLYDGINLAALAMVMAKSTDPSVYGPEHRHDRQRRAGRDRLLLLRVVRQPARRGQGDQVRGARRPDQLRQLPRLDRHLPGRHLQCQRPGKRRRQPERRATARTGRMSIFLASVGFGLVTASVLAIAAVGFTLQFGVTDVLNLAYGAVMIAGAFLAYLLNSHGVNIWIGLVVAVAACAAGSVLLNAGVYAPFQRRGTAPITMVIVSLGMTLIIEFGVQAIAGGTSVSYTMSQGPSVSADGFTLTAVQFAVIGLSLLVMAGTHALLRYTRLGKAMRATAANRTLARNCGIRTGRVITATWAITGGLCGLAGVVFAMDAGSFNATSTDLFLVLILAATFLGGPGQAYGAMVGALVIGLATEVSAAYITPSYKYVIAFVALLVMLGVRPTGLFGKTA